MIPFIIIDGITFLVNALIHIHISIYANNIDNFFVI